MAEAYNYCPYCGGELQPFSDGERLRSRCPNCLWIYYRNPTVGVAVIVLRHSSLDNYPMEILLGERRDGGWCIPCGHVEWNEDVAQAAKREFLEETGLLVELERVYAVHSNFHNPNQHTVGVWYLALSAAGKLHPGGDLCEVRFFSLDLLPELKFPTDRKVIGQLRSDYLD